ncbi:MAG: hypothetical protein WA055_00460 [Candidatus Moraniibacteriota bacterium]
MQQHKKILIISIIAVVLFAVIFLFIINRNYKKKISTSSGQNVQAPPVLLTEDKKTEIANAKNIIGKIVSINIDNIEIITSKGEKLTLNVPQAGASFVMQIIQKDGNFLNKEIGLFDIMKNKEVKIQYNSKTNDVMLIMVK